VEDVETDPDDRSEFEVKLEMEENDVEILASVINECCKNEPFDCERRLRDQAVDDIKDN
jgi:hypothetical protein